MPADHAVTPLVTKTDSGKPHTAPSHSNHSHGSPSSHSHDSDSNNQNVKKSTSNKKVVIATTQSATTANAARKSTKTPASTDWRLNLPGILPKWEYILENKLFNDVTFIVGPGKEAIKSHSLVLKMQSRYFESALTSDNKEIEVPDCSPAVFHKILKYLYTDKLEITPEIAMDTLVLARKFHLTALQAKCGRIVLEGVSVNNAAVLLKKAEEMGDKQLSLKVQEYILQHASQVVSTPAFCKISLHSLQKLLQANRVLWKMSEVKILEAVKAWAASECARKGLENTGPNQYVVAKDALDLIHFSQFKPLEFTSQVVKPKLLPNDKMLEIQSELIEKEEKRRVEYTPPPQEHNEEEAAASARPSEDERPNTATTNNLIDLARSPSEEAETVNEDIDQVKYDTVYTLNRYSAVSPKEWKSESDDGTYKITFQSSKTVNVTSLGLYGRGNGTLVDIYIQFLTFDEEKAHLEFETKTELPEDGGEFEVKLPRPLSLNKLEWYTVVVSVQGSVYPTGVGGKRTYTIDLSDGDTASFYFKNSKAVQGAAHVRGQLPRIYFSVPPALT